MNFHILPDHTLSTIGTLKQENLHFTYFILHYKMGSSSYQFRVHKKHFRQSFSMTTHFIVMSTCTVDIQHHSTHLVEREPNLTNAVDFELSSYHSPKFRVNHSYSHYGFLQF